MKQGQEYFITLLSPEQVSVAQAAQSVALTSQQLGVLETLQTMYSKRIARETRVAVAAQDATRTAMLVSAGVVLVMIIGASVAMVALIRRRALEQDAQGAKNELETRLQRALEMAETEVDIFETVANAVRITDPELSAEMLLADTSRAHLHQVASSNVKPSSGCPVAAPMSCPAASHGQTQIFESSAAIDACPQLRGRSGGPRSAICVPINVAGRPMGVLHATAQDGEPPSESAVALDLIARRAGERLSLMRAFSRSEMQASTDPLTGLMNRRSVESNAEDLIDTGESYVVAYADLDHFKVLNDVHGHDAGDRALRLFAHVLRDRVRPTDLPARYGGEEFVVVLPGCSTEDAAAVMERVRRSLADVLRAADGPDFTVTVGIAPSTMVEPSARSSRPPTGYSCKARPPVVTAC